MTGPDRNQERMAELLAGEATADLTEQERIELAEQLRRAAPADRDEFLRLAARIQLGFLKGDAGSMQRMPADLGSRLLRQAEAWPANRQATTGTSPGTSPVTDLDSARRRRPAGSGAVAPTKTFNWAAASGWAMAAAFAIAFVITGGPADMGKLGSPEAERTALLREAGDVVTVPWGVSDQPGYQGVKGDVVWSTQQQAGFMRLAGLPANDPAKAQYQLWIVDPTRDAHPVDGGVFNVSAGGSVVIPIRAKIAVNSPRAFAITLEQPGGVVVSKGPLLVVAPIST